MTSLMNASKHPLAVELELLRGIVLDASARIREGVKWNAPSYRTTEWFATLNGPRHVREPMVVLHAGAKAKGVTLRDEIADPTGMLRWLGADRALVTFANAAEIRARKKAFQAVLRSWISHL